MPASSRPGSSTSATSSSRARPPSLWRSCAAATLTSATLLAGRVHAELGRPDLLGAIQPAEIYRSCWRVLHDCGDTRAGEAAEAARQYLQSSAAKIDDSELRASFLRRVPANVELARLGSDGV